MRQNVNLRLRIFKIYNDCDKMCNVHQLPVFAFHVLSTGFTFTSCVETGSLKIPNGELLSAEMQVHGVSQSTVQEAEAEVYPSAAVPVCPQSLCVHK